MSDQSASERHSTRMARKKQVVDTAIAAAAKERGVFLVNTGNVSDIGMVKHAFKDGIKAMPGMAF